MSATKKTVEAVIADFETDIAELDAKKADILRIINGIRQKLGQNGNDGSKAPKSSTAIPPNAFVDMTVKDATIKYLGLVNSYQPYKVIAEVLTEGGLISKSKDFANTVRSILNGVVNAKGGIIKSKKHGYGLPEWDKRTKQANQNNEADEEQKMKGADTKN